MLEFILKMFFGLLSVRTIGSLAVLLTSYSEGCLTFISLSNQPSQPRPTIVNVYSKSTTLLFIYCKC